MSDTKQFIEENHNLIYKFLQQYNLSMDDYYDIAAIGLCKAAKKFDPERGVTFSTYAFKSMQNEYFMTLRKKQLPTMSIYEKLPDVEAELEFIETIQDNNSENDLYIVAISEDISKWYSSLCDLDKNIIKYLSSGLSQRDIGKILKITQSYVSRRIKNLRKGFLEIC